MPDWWVGIPIFMGLLVACVAGSHWVFKKTQS